MKAALQQFIRDEDGAAMIEYGLLAALISVVALGALTDIGTSINSAFGKIKDKLATTK